MNDAVKSLKTIQILDAAKKEFSEKGYERASTERICVNAGVSKGLLFHHFGTKKGLYLEVYETFLADYIGKLELLAFDGSETYFDYIKKLSNAKVDYLSNNPNAYEIIFEARYNPPNELKEELKVIFDKYVNMDRYFSESFFKRHKFRDGIDPKKAWEIVLVVTALIERKIMDEMNENGKKGQPTLEMVKAKSGEFLEYFEIIYHGIAPEAKTCGRAGK